MTRTTLDLPCDPSDLATWLEDRLLGPGLRDLVDDLAAAAGSAAPTHLSAPELLGGAQAAVLERGLGAMAPGSLLALLDHPHLLLDLQELVFADGGPYWDRPAPAAFADLKARGRERLRKFLRVDELARPAPARAQRGRFAQPYLGWMAAAASLLALAFTLQLRAPGTQPTTQVVQPGAEGPRPPSAPANAVLLSGGWGWSKPGVLPRDVGPREYLLALASAAEEWSKRSPDSPDALARRLGEFRMGCSTILLADHPPLSAFERDWLLEHCRHWAEQIDELVTSLEQNRDVSQIRAEADSIVSRLAKAIRDRAQGLPAKTA
jgi:hypothetical protein